MKEHGPGKARFNNCNNWLEMNITIKILCDNFDVSFGDASVPFPLYFLQIPDILQAGCFFHSRVWDGHEGDRKVPVAECIEAILRHVMDVCTFMHFFPAFFKKRFQAVRIEISLT